MSYKPSCVKFDAFSTEIYSFLSKRIRLSQSVNKYLNFGIVIFLEISYFAWYKLIKAAYD